MFWISYKLPYCVAREQWVIFSIQYLFDQYHVSMHSIFKNMFLEPCLTGEYNVHVRYANHLNIYIINVPTWRYTVKTSSLVLDISLLQRIKLVAKMMVIKPWLGYYIYTKFCELIGEEIIILLSSIVIIKRIRIYFQSCI